MYVGKHRFASCQEIESNNIIIYISPNDISIHPRYLRAPIVVILHIC